MNRKSIIQTIISVHASTFKYGHNYSLNPTEKQMKNAILSYATGCQPEDIIAIFDETLRSNGKKGLLFTEEGVYTAEVDYQVNKTERTSLPIRYDEVQSIEASGYFVYIHYTDESVTKAYLGIKTDSFAGLFTMIQKAITHDLYQTMKDGSENHIMVISRLWQENRLFLLGTGEYQGTAISLFYEVVKDGYRIVQDLNEAQALCALFYEQDPSLGALLYDEKEAEPSGEVPKSDSEDIEPLEGTVSDIDSSAESDTEVDNILYLLDENGDKMPFEFLDFISDNGKDYVVLLSLEDSDDGEVVILQVDDSGTDSESESYIIVDSDETLDKIFDLFKKRNAEHFTFADQNQDTESEKPVPFEGNEPYIFISYSHKDANTVLRIVSQLQHDGFRVWYDEGIDPGAEWDENIAAHLEHCSCFIAFMSENYVNSNNCRDEVNYARDLDLRRLLIYLDDVKLTGGMAMRLNRLQALFYHKYQLKPLFFKKLYESGVLSDSGARRCDE